MAYILDGAVILVLLLAAIFGYRHGFVRSVIRLIGCFAAILVAALLARPVAGAVFDGFFREPVEQKIMTYVQETTSASGLQQALDELPGPVKNLMEANGIGSAEEMLQAVGVSGEESSETVAVAVTDKVIAPLCEFFLSACIFFILFILLMLVVSLVARLVNGLFQVPLLRQVNGALGAVIGLLQGLLFLCVGVLVLETAAGAMGEGAWLTEQTLGDTVLVRSLLQWNPLSRVWDTLLQNVLSLF